MEEETAKIDENVNRRHAGIRKWRKGQRK